MTCQEYAVLLEKYLDGLTTPEEEALLRTHEAQCPACQAQAALLPTLEHNLAALAEDVPPLPEDFHASWVSRLEDQPMQQSTRRISWSRMLATAAALVFVVGGTLLTRDQLGAAPLAGSSLKRSAYEESYDYSAGTVTGYGMNRAASMESGANDVMLTAYDEAVEEESAAAVKKIIRSASLTIQTPAFEESLAQVKTMCLDHGGWIAHASESSGGTRRTASLTLRVPAPSLDVFLEGLGGAGRITRREESADDVTESYYDTQARLQTQQALMERLQSLITTAADLSDLLSLESQIADTQYQIDRLQSSLNATDRQVDYATVDVSLREELPTDSLTQTEQTLFQRIADALSVGVESFLTFLSDAVVFLAAALPFAAVAGLLWGVVRLIRKANKRKTHKE